MNTKLKFLLFFVLLLGSASAFAQYGYGYPYGGGMGGVDRSIGRVPNVPKSKKKDKGEQKDFIQLTVEYLDKRLKLDDFQAAAITTIYNKHKDEILAISAEDQPVNVIKEKMRLITEEIDSKVIPLLSKPQVEEYNKMVAERK